jgi:CRISPR/Cas system-associated exonuclease Cas4 (RecB family)
MEEAGFGVESLGFRVLCECGKHIEVCSIHGNGLTRRIIGRFGSKRFKNQIGTYHVTELCRCLKQSFLERRHGHLETYGEVWSKQRGNALHRHVSYAFDGWKELPIQMLIPLDNESIRVTGHVDLFDLERRELIELKSTRAVEWQHKKHLLPHRHHVLQLQSYYSIWTQCYHLPAEKLSVAYMDEKTPPTLYEVEKLDLTDWLRWRAVALHKAVQEDRMPKGEPSTLCHYCSFKDVCSAGQHFLLSNCVTKVDTGK